MQASSTKRVAVIFNPTKINITRLRTSVEKAFDDETHFTWLATTPEDAGAGIAKTALESGIDALIVAGGDGTVRAVASAMRDSHVPLTIVPAGTGNVLARNLSLPLTNLERAVSLAVNGATRNIDLGFVELERPDGSVDTSIFLVMCGIGLDAEIMATTRSSVKRILGWVAYVGAALHVASRSARFVARIKVKNEPSVIVRPHTILVGNCGTMPGNIILLPNAAIDDGSLDIVAMAPKNPFGWLSIGRRVLVEHPLETSAAGRRLVQFTQGAKPLRQLTYLRGPAVDIQLQDPRPAEIDGDVAGDAVRMKLWITHDSLSVTVPQSVAIGDDRTFTQR